ncbi:TPA: hypothetical protein IP933_000808 [Listeria monocytogenes]|uniref:hypothetical protein n=1 Tax=Listeria monocytogenes TaxID=1639 RepID=UPI0008748805|nr:hypothetical protein [Listeria monocytogenes]EAF4502421.1 hypothetical protein [Listeria monocytogenes serotype 4b]EAF4506721.1 hypothetical protein [Listeria monocytogenes serotype 1/2a]EHC6176860.1 hypothetical protein [Listeria monocytogenes serotype 1/2b]EHC6203364.1 hypothetical protein [Listeria monocytogenes serotype 1/2c]EAC2547462.1 hypothetical protein [Listeria monocytogenes]
MFEKLDIYLLDFINENSSEDFWYDYTYLQAQELLNNFTQSDWVELYQNIVTKGDLWKIRVAYCIDEDMGMNGFEFLLSLMNDGDDVAECAIDSLRSFDSEEYKNIIHSDHILKIKTQKLLEDASLPVKRVLEAFLQQNK